MLAVALENVTPRGRRAGPLTASFAGSTHTAILGPPGSGKSTLLDLVGGSVRAEGGRITIGTRDATSLRPSGRPVFHSIRTEPIRLRWSVRHLLVAAARRRAGLDYDDRIAEVERAARDWGVGTLLDRRIRELSSHERLRARLAQIIVLRPAVLLAERLFADATAGAAADLEDAFWRRLRVDGCTVLHEPSRIEEVGWADRAILLEGGVVVASGTPRALLDAAPTAALAELVAPGSRVPVDVRGGRVDSPLGSWSVEPPPFQGAGVAVVRPWDIRVAGPGEESDFILGIDEARFEGGRWEVTGVITGGGLLRVWLEPDARPEKGRPLPMRVEGERIRLYPDSAARAVGVPLDVVPSRRDSR